MRFILLEDTYSANSVFVDTATGKRYVYKNGKFVELKQNKNKGKSNKGKDKDKENNKSDDNSSDGQNENPSDSKDGQEGNSDGSSSDSSDPNSQGNQKRNKEGSKGNKDGPQIGDRPENDEILDQEEEERRKEAEENGETETEEEREKRIGELNRMLGDDKTSDELKDETERKVFKSRQTKAEKERKKQLKDYKTGANLHGFPTSIENFIKNELKSSKTKTYSKLHKTYNSNAGSVIIRQGKKERKSTNKPSINVYYDQSGSWGQSDIELGNQAISVLKKYVDKGLISVDIYYFANRVGDRPNTDRYLGGGTEGKPVLDHIVQTNPDNVIIMTDWDTNRNTDLYNVTVPGGVWFLWRDGQVSDNLKNHLKGKKSTKSFSISR